MREEHLLNGMCAVAVFVQIAVYGATKIHTHGALLEEWQPYFGLPYALAFLALQFWYCRAFDRPRGLRSLGFVWLIATPLYLVIRLWGPQPVPGWRDFFALVSGFGAILLCARWHNGDG